MTGVPANKSWILETVKESLRVLASPAKEQIAELKKSEPSSVDDLANDFSEIAHALLDQFPNLTVEERDAIVSIDKYLDTMSGAQNSELWTAEALVNAPEWQHVRELATDPERKFAKVQVP